MSQGTQKQYVVVPVRFMFYSTWKNLKLSGNYNSVHEKTPWKSFFLSCDNDWYDNEGVRSKGASGTKTKFRENLL